VRFLVDECLSVELVLTVEEAGFDAHDIAHVGKAGWKDWNVAQYASQRDLVLVTNNGADFRRLYAKASIHPGLIITTPSVDRTMQRRLFRGAMGELAVVGEPINQVLEVDLDGETVTFSLFDLPI